MKMKIKDILIRLNEIDKILYYKANFEIQNSRALSLIQEGHEENNKAKTSEGEKELNYTQDKLKEIQTLEKEQRRLKRAYDLMIDPKEDGYHGPGLPLPADFSEWIIDIPEYVVPTKRTAITEERYKSPYTIDQVMALIRPNRSYRRGKLSQFFGGGM
jgi:hypothetical protein